MFLGYARLKSLIMLHQNRTINPQNDAMIVLVQKEEECNIETKTMGRLQKLRFIWMNWIYTGKD